MSFQSSPPYFDMTPDSSCHAKVNFRATPEPLRSGSGRSGTSSVPTNIRIALDCLYKSIYGPDSVRCLLTQGEGGLQVAHAVRRTSTSSELNLYEYCLGFELKGFHVDTQQNIFFLKSDWHHQFDANRWILLPSTEVLEDTRDFVRSVISARQESPRAVPTFSSKASHQLSGSACHHSTTHQARPVLASERCTTARNRPIDAAVGRASLPIPHRARLGVPHRAAICGHQRRTQMRGH